MDKMNTPPPVPPKYKMPKRKSNSLVIGIVGIVAILLIAVLISNIASDEEETTPVISKEEWSQQIKESLENQSELMDSIESQYKSDSDPLLLQGNIQTLREIADKHISDSLYMDVYDLPEVVMLMDKNSKRASTILPKVLTHTREVYVKQLSEKLWENNIDVISANGGTTIVFIGGAFANRKNIKDWQTKVGAELGAMGFKRVEYRWIKDDPEPVYYDMTK